MSKFRFFRKKRNYTKKMIVVGVALLLTVSFSEIGYASGIPASLVMDGMKYPIEQTSPFTDQGTTWVPLRFVTDKMGAKMALDPKTNKIEISRGENRFTLTVGSSTALVNGQSVDLGAAVIQKEGTTMVPLRFVSEQLSAEVTRDSSLGTINIHTPNKNLGELDPYGRKIRTTNLPKNDKDYPYILEDTPNEMYEMEKGFAKAFGYKSPAFLLKNNSEFTKENIDLWMDHVVSYGNLMMNVDYNTIGDQWVEQMLPHILSPTEDGVRRRLKEYMNWVKENKIKIEGFIDPEPSMIFHDRWICYFARARVKFKITSYNVEKDILYMTIGKGKPLKKNVWYTGYVDLELFTNVGGVWGDTLRVSPNADIHHYSILKKL